MSQRKFTYKNYDVLTGWDRPLQTLFISIFDKSVPEDVDDSVYDSMYARNLRPLTDIAEFAGTLVGQLNPELDGDLVLPIEYLQDLLSDMENNVGNVIKHYGVLGVTK